jgi:fatty-acyl-CoA synthase
MKPFVASMPVAAQYPATSIGAAVLAMAELQPDAPALIMPEVRVSFLGLVQRARVVASALLARGVRPGEHIGLLMASRAEYVELVLGAALAGIVPVLFNHLATPEGLERLSRELEIRYLFATREGGRDHVAVASKITLNGAGGPRDGMTIVVVGRGAREGHPAYADFTSSDLPIHPALPEITSALTPASAFAVVFTAGVTNRAKLCRVLNENLLCKIRPFADRFALRPGSRLWIALPMFQNGFLQALATALASGAAVVTSSEFDPVVAMQQLEAAQVTHAYPIYAPYWLPIIFHPDFLPSRFPRLSNICLSAKMPVLQRVQRALPQTVVMNTYGSAEEAGAFCLPRSEDPARIRLGTAGKPLPGHEVRIVDPSSGEVCATGEVGEIQVHGVGVVPAYRDFPRSFSPDGWLRTEDLGSVDASGAVKYLGRLSDLLSIGGENVSAGAIEAVLQEHPAVALAQVIGREDKVLGHLAQAFVELRPGQTFDVEDLLAFCATRLKDSHVPRYVTIVEDWPMSASKINRRLLLELPMGRRCRD